MSDEKQAPNIVEMLGNIQKDVDTIMAERDASVKSGAPVPGWLKGDRTVIAGWTMGGAVITGLLGIDYNPEKVIGFITEFSQHLKVFFAGLAAAVHTFRRKA